MHMCTQENEEISLRIKDKHIQIIGSWFQSLIFLN